MIVYTSTILKKGQGEFVDIEISSGEKSTLAFIRPYALTNLKKGDLGFEYKNEIMNMIESFFSYLLKCLQDNNNKELKEISRNLGEAKYVQLGYGNAKQGKAFGKEKFLNLCDSIKKSEAYSSGIIGHIKDVDIFVDGIGDDLVSDLLAVLLYPILSDFTKMIVEKYSEHSGLLEIKDIECWNELENKWESKQLHFLAYAGQHYLLTPMSFVSEEYSSQRIRRELHEIGIHPIYEEMILVESGEVRFVPKKETLSISLGIPYDKCGSTPSKKDFLYLVQENISEYLIRTEGYNGKA